MNTVNPRRGYLLGLSAYVVWGLFPLYFKAIAEVPARRSSPPDHLVGRRRCFAEVAGLEAPQLVARTARQSATPGGIEPKWSADCRANWLSNDGQ